MANVDTRLGRQSATCILMPFMLSGVYSGIAGVSKEERWAVSWMYASLAAIVVVAGKTFLKRLRNILFIIIKEEE